MTSVRKYLVTVQVHGAFSDLDGGFLLESQQRQVSEVDNLHEMNHSRCQASVRPTGDLKSLAAGQQSKADKEWALEASVLGRSTCMRYLSVQGDETHTIGRKARKSDHGM